MPKVETFIKENDKMRSIHFDSYADFLNTEIEEGANSSRANRYRFGDRGPGGSRYARWFGSTNKSGDDAMDHAALGDEKLSKMIAEWRKDLDNITKTNTVDYEQRVSVSKRRLKHGDFGDELDIHKVYQGQLDTAWRRTERIQVDQTHKLVTLFVDIGGNCNIDCDATLWRAVVTCRVVEELEAAGKSVKVVVGSATHGLFQSDKLMATKTVVVKQFNQPLAMERLAAMTHLGFYRSWGFVATCMFEQKVVGNLGYHADIEQCIPIQLQEEIDEGHTRFVHIPDCTRIDQAKRALGNVYAALDKFSKEAAA